MDTTTQAPPSTSSLRDALDAASQDTADQVTAIKARTLAFLADGNVSMMGGWV